MPAAERAVRYSNMRHLFKLPIGAPKYHRVIQAYTMEDGTTAFRLNYNEAAFDEASCKGLNTEMFFPNQEIYAPSEVLYFNTMCSPCPAKAACLEWALAHERHGIWAGTTPHMRRDMRKEIGWGIHEPASFPNL